MLTSELDATLHTNSVASIAAGVFAQGSGALDARIVSANVCYDPAKKYGYDLVDLVAPAESNLQFLPSALNHSYGPAGLVELPEPYNNAMDFRIRLGRTNEVHACGNDGSGNPGSNPPRSSANLPAACNEYNSIKVGGYGDESTVDWSDDIRYGSGSYVNPLVRPGSGTMLVESDRELPEVLGPALAVRRGAITWQSTDSTLTSRGNGTSFAAPNVAALATLFLDRFPGLAVTPEFVRAAVYATAVHNWFDGVERPPPDFSGAGKVGSGFLANDSRTGFGGVSGKALNLLISGQGPSQGVFQQLVVERGHFEDIPDQNESRRLFSQCNLPLGGGPCAIGNSKLLRVVPTSTAVPYERVRIVLAWNSRLDCIQCTPDLITKNQPIDFDLVLVDGTTDEMLWWDQAQETWSTTLGEGCPVSSLSFSNSYEVFDLSAAQVSSLPANTRVEIRAFGPLPATFSERLGYVAFAVPELSEVAPQ